jgi:hypothetical protein
MLEPDHMRDLLHQDCRRVSEGEQLARQGEGVKVLSPALEILNISKT